LKCIVLTLKSKIFDFKLISLFILKLDVEKHNLFFELIYVFNVFVFKFPFVSKLKLPLLFTAVNIVDILI
jgi:hypothetical protein